MNSVSLSGNLTRSPEIKKTQSGKSVMNFGIAVNERVKDASGNWTDRPNFFEVVVFGNRADALSKILDRGMKVALTGKLAYSSWDDKNGGGKRSKVEVIANDIDLMQRREGQQNGSYAPQNQQQGNYANNQQYAPQQPTGGYQQQRYQQNQGYQGGQQGYQQQGYQQPMDVSSDDIPFSYSTLD